MMEMKRDQCVPTVVDYGMMIITNFNLIDDGKNKSSKTSENEKIAGYFIMEKFDLNVEQYFM